MNLYLLTQLAATIKENPEGFTVSTDFTESPSSGYCVSVKQTQNHFGITGCFRAYLYALEHNLFFGGWFNKDNEKFYFDAVKVFPIGKLKEAMAFAKRNKQLSIFDLDNNIEIEVK